MCGHHEKEKKEYAEDPVFRAKKLASGAACEKFHRKEINAQRRRRRRQEDPAYAEKARVQDRARNRKCKLKKYGITLEEYDAMLARQGGRCKICRKKADKLLFVDHCHAFLAIRGLLCRGCNTMLGFAKDNPVVLQEGARYLRRFLRQMRRLLGDGGSDRKRFHLRRRYR
jgi:Autographiviridae endonuclease VII